MAGWNYLHSLPMSPEAATVAAKEAERLTAYWQRKADNARRNGRHDKAVRLQERADGHKARMLALTNQQ